MDGLQAKASASVVLSSSLLSSCSPDNAFLLVGQHSVTGSTETRRRSLIIVFDAIACPELDVVEEQGDCLEQILPFGLTLLGVLLPSNAATLTTDPKSFLKRGDDDVPFVVLTRSANSIVQCRAMKSGESLTFDLCDTSPLFVSLSFYFTSSVDTLLLLIRAQTGEKEKLIHVDTSSYHAIARCDNWDTQESCYVVQLGGTVSQDDKLIHAHITFAPHHCCGYDLYHVIQSSVRKLREKPGARIIRIQSVRNRRLFFQWISNRYNAGTQTLPENDWKELSELLEDAAGEALALEQIVRPTNQGTSTLPKVEETKANMTTVGTSLGETAVGKSKEVPGILFIVLPLLLAVLSICAAAAVWQARG
ncbi:putative protein kinase-like protein [Trypanosoma vivax]|nr:putative protein kinase-like protein [Trypanosoma vivax]